MDNKWKVGQHISYQTLTHRGSGFTSAFVRTGYGAQAAGNGGQHTRDNGTLDVMALSVRFRIEFSMHTVIKLFS